MWDTTKNGKKKKKREKESKQEREFTLSTNKPNNLLVTKVAE